VSGSLIGLDALDVGLAPGDGPPSAWQAATVEGGRFRATVPTRQPDRSGEPRPLRTGGYRLHARDTDLVLSAAGSTPLPFTHLDDTAKLTFTRRARGRLGVEVAGPVPDELLSRYAQERLIEKFATTPRRLEEAVFFVVDLGSNTGDSALALHEELRRRGSSLRLYWGIDDRSVVVPDGGIPIVKFSVDWFAKLNASRYVVNNYGGVWGLEKDPEQRYLQTWHGTPLKYIGASEARQTNAPESRLDVIARESSAWDALISPSPYFTELARTEFRYEGPVLETGYPRNDRLANATSDDVAKLRATFALPTAAKVVLYAPTYRDDQRHGWKADLFEGLDLDRLLEQLGPDWRVLLRGHSFSARADHVDRSGGRILDVTRHPDVNDLYLVADLLVTDYSSVMFDYSVTGKPMAFFVPDLEQYAATRGMYFGLAECAPGPLCTDVDGLAGEVRDLGALAERYREKYAAFRQRFAPWDDGKAAARVVDQFF
jgi:CDP-glycerol glycerophosphotransferase